MVRALLALALLAGCDGDAPTGKRDDTAAVKDEDGDGWGADEDCDESDPEVNPDAVEACDGIDNDCDDGIDENLIQSWWPDADDDGYGSAASSQEACTAPVGHVTNADDCDDTSPDVNPDGVEICDGEDQDCDGDVDEGVLLTVYVDADGDGYGDDALATEACAVEAGWSLTSDDCDDTRADVHPSAQESDCTDPVDYNCDGSTGYADADGDGFAACEDCDDLDLSENPEADEICDGDDDDCDGEVDEADATDAATWYADADADAFGDPATATPACDAPAGYVADATDCDDDDATAFPGAVEVCDDADDDCDGAIDDAASDAPTWHADSDGDGFGDAAVAEVTCDAPVGYVADATDCDDGDAGTSPSADETCDGEDDDCDGDVDEPDAVDAPTWYTDADLDGYGDPAAPTVACEAPAGGVADASDCDDGDGAVHPAATESCNGVDDDCDALVDEAGAAGEATWYRDADADGHGDPAATALSCDAPSSYVAVAGDCDDADAAEMPGAVETCDGDDDDCDGLADEAGATGETAWYFDGDADGYGDAAASVVACDAPPSYVATSGDCDDADGATHPAATETCDGVDDDCDGVADDAAADASTWYRDDDGDGYGSATRVSSCDAPTGYVALAGDCDDVVATVNPLATEVCDGIDNDCDGAADPATSADATTWYRDGDGDGYGSSTSTTACSAPSTYVASGGDCDDTTSSVSPADAEVCDDAVDQDCDGVADDGCPTVVEHCGTITASETWSGADTHYVSCDVYVQGATAPVLTIEDGALVEFAAGAGLRIAQSNYGSLRVEGTTTGVTFTSVSATPAAGDWEGISVYQYDRGTTIDGATVEYGGGNTYGGIQLYYTIYANPSPVTITDTVVRESSNSGLYARSNAYVAISGSTFEDNTDYGVYLDSTSDLYETGGPTFTDNVVTGNAWPIYLHPDYVDQLDASSSFAGNTDDWVYVQSGTVAGTGTWQHLDVDYRVVGDVIVAGSLAPELTVEDGVTVAFQSGTGLSVGTTSYGSLAAAGATLGITFTGTTASPGAWDGLTFSTNDMGSTLSGVTVEYGGANTFGNVYVYNTPAAVTIAGSTIRDGSNSGVYLSTTAIADISGTTVEDNVDHGVYVSSNSTLYEPTTGASFTDNVVTGNGLYPVYIPVDNLGQLDGTSTYTGNGTDRIYVQSGTANSDATWQDLDVDYYVAGDIYFQHSSTPELTIEDGVTMEFATGAGFSVATSTYGLVRVEGSTLGVTLTSAQSVPGAGDWDGLTIGTYDGGSEIVGATVEYAGANTYGNIRLTSCDYVGTGVLIADSVVKDGSNSGIYVSSCTVEIADTVVRDNAEYGVYLDSSSLLEPLVGTTGFSGNTLTGNDLYPIYLYANELDELDATSSFSGNGTDRIYVLGDTVDHTGTWRDLGVPFFVNGDVYVRGSARPVLTVEPGVTMEFTTSSAFSVGNSNYGEVYAVGTSAEPITFTSAQAVPSNGDWDGIGVYSYDQGSTFQYVTVAYGGQTTSGAVYLNNADYVSFTDSTVSYSRTYGIYRYSCAPAISSITYVGNTSGDLY
ncbi:MAG: MopE-related protein [Myxococcota bacterium]